MGPAAHADVSGDGVVKAGPGMLVSVLLTAGGANATLILYDDPDSADGTVLCKIAALQNDSNDFCPSMPIPFHKGCYADIGGAGANATVQYA